MRKVMLSGRPGREKRLLVRTRIAIAASDDVVM